MRRLEEQKSRMEEDHASAPYDDASCHGARHDGESGNISEANRQQIEEADSMMIRFDRSY